MMEQEKHYAHYLTVTEFFKLDSACVILWRAFGGMGGTYLVGSAMQKQNWRDVDVCTILDDAEFDRLFPVTNDFGENVQWKLFCIAISEYLSSVTGLPIDYKIQQQTRANAMFGDKPRNAIGLFMHHPQAEPEQK